MIKIIVVGGAWGISTPLISTPLISTSLISTPLNAAQCGAMQITTVRLRAMIAMTLTWQPEV
jgi:hypothetical protein